MTGQVEVTLKKAQTYIHQPTGLRFEYDIPRIVSHEIAEYLFSNAVKSVKTSSGGRVSREDVRLFEFAPVDEGVSDDDDDEADAPAATLSDTLRGATVVRKPVDPVPAPAAGGEGQARSRARGAKPGQTASA